MTALSPPLRVLLVDDTAEIRRLMRLVLARSGRFEVVGEAEDGDAAVDAAGRLRPDLVLLDLAMPGTDGIQALPRLRSVAPDAAVIVLSGFAADAFREAVLAAGAQGYLEKRRLLQIPGKLEQLLGLNGRHLTEA